MTLNLISVGKLDDLGYKIGFDNQSWHISKSNLVVANGAKVGSLYPLYVSLMTELPSVAMWHSRLGHMSRKGMEHFNVRATYRLFHFLISRFVSIVSMANRHEFQGMYTSRKIDSPWI